MSQGKKSVIDFLNYKEISRPFRKSLSDLKEKSLTYNWLKLIAPINLARIPLRWDLNEDKKIVRKSTKNDS